MKRAEPRSRTSSAPTLVFIGRNSRGQWVAQEQSGLYGGLFLNRAEAIKYALFENGHHAETVIELSREIELGLDGRLVPLGLLATTGKWPIAWPGLTGGLRRRVRDVT